MGFLLIKKMTAARTRIRGFHGYYMGLNFGVFWQMGRHMDSDFRARESDSISENYQQSWCEELHALILEIKGEVDSVSEHSCSLRPHKIADFEDRYFRIIENGLNEIPIPADLDFPGKRGRKKQSKAKNLIDRCILFQREILSFMHNFSNPLFE
jgi:hypothetical protein